MLRQQQLFIRRDSDAPRSPSSSETDEPLHHTAVPARPPRSPRKRPPSWTNSRVGGPGGSPRSARHGEADDDADVELEQEVQTPGMAISFDIDSDVSPCISSDELAPSQLPPTYTERPFQPHTHLAPHSSRPFNPHRPYTSPSPPSYPSSSQSSFHYSHKVRPSALASARSLSFAHAHAQRQTRIQGRHTQAEGDPNYDVGALGTSRPKDAYGRLDQHQAGELSEVGGLSFPEFILGLEDASEGSGSGTRSATISQSSNRGRVPLPISISFESDMSEDETPGTASTLRTARPRGNIFNTAGDFTYRTQRATRPPATASPSYRLGWRHRAAPPPLIRSASCPFIGGISGDTASVQQHAAADSLTSPFDYAQHIGQAEETAIMRQSQFGDKLVVEPSQTLRRAMSTGSRSKRNTFGPCEIYDDAGGEFPGTGYPGSINIGMSTGVPVVSTGANHSTPAAQDTIPRRMPARSITDDSLANGRHHGDDIPPTGAHALRVQQRCCPSQPCSAGPSPTQGPTTVFLNPNDFGTLPASVQMTPTSSLDGIVGVIQAAGVLASEIEVDEDAWTESKDGLQESKDGSDYAGYEQSADTIAIACTDNAAADLDHNALPNQAETSTDEYGRVRNAKGPIDGGWQSEKDVSGVYALGNDSPILPHDPLPPISSFTPTAGQSDEGTPPAPPPASLERDDAVDAGDALDPLDDSLIHSTSVNNTQPCSTVSYTCVSLQHTNSLSTPSPDSETLRDSISLSTPLEPPLASSSTRPDTSVKGAVSQSTGERKEISREDGQHTPSPEIAIDRPAPKTPPTAHRVSVLYPTPPPLSALPPTPTSAPGDISRSVSRSSKRLSYQLSPSPSVRRALTVSSPHSNRTPSPTSRSSPLLPALSTPDRPRRATSVYVARSAEDQDTAGEEESNMALHVDIRSNQYPSTISHPGHQKQPSVPYSTRSTHSSFSTSTVPFDAPNNYFNRTSVQRLSRFTAASGSSGSSIYSSDSDAGIGKIQYRVTERPEISTVFEEEGSFDVSPGGHERYSPPLRHKQSNSTLDSAHCIPYSATRRQRAGTISSQFSGISDRSAHPFAASASRSMENRTGGLLKPAMPRLQPSRSSPNLRVMAKEGPLSIHQLTLADNSEEDDEKCPVCIESLNASFKLPGEKPHIVPECGHALHEECFTHVYGDVPSSGSTRNVGLCGVCRQPIKIAEGGGDKKGKRGKFAAMTGQGSGLRGGSSTSVNSSSPSVSSNLQANDPVVPMSSNSPKRGGIDSTPRIVIPHISVRPEMATMNRQKRQMAAMITVQLPSAGERERYPRPNRSKSEVSLSPALPPSPISTSSMDGMMTHQAAIGGTLPLEAVQADLERRLQDFGKSSLDGCGPLRLYDLLDVRKGDTKRPFLMYLFSDALACISEETPSALSKMFKSGGTLRASKSSRSLASAPPKTTLKLRGRIHFKHVRKVIDSSTANELSLTILMIDENHQTFILVFKDRMQYDLWRNMLDKIVKEVRDRGMSEKGGNSASKVAKLMGTGAPVALRKANPGISPSSTINSGMSGLGLGGVDVMSPSMSTYSHDNDVAPSYSTPLQPLGPIHTPVDLVIVLAIPQAASAPESAPLKIRLMRQALGFILATLGPGDRISLVSCEQGVNVRKTPLLCPTRPDSRRRLEAFVENLGTGGAQEDDTEVEFAPDERADLVTAMNVSLDVLLQRTAKNPLAGLMVVSDTAEVVRAGQLELIFARLDSVSIPIHTIGYGKAHDPRPLWLLCNQSNGTYTFVREWYHLRDTLAGIVGGLTSIAMTRARISLSCADKDFKIARIMGVQTPIPAQGAKTIDIELRDLRYGETREILVEFDYEGDGTSAPRSRPNTGLSGSFSMDRVSLEDPSSVVKDMLADGRLAEDIPVVEVDCSYHDPASGRSVSRLTQPLLLTIPIVSAPTPQPANSRILAFDPMVKRRRMEILASDMIARALLLMTRQNSNQAERLLLETRGVISRLISTIHDSLPHDRPASSRKEILAVQNADMMQSVADDLETLAEAVLDQPQVFERDHRNMATQQANILRTQRSWTTRSATERMYCTEEVRELLQLSGEWTVRA